MCVTLIISFLWDSGSLPAMGKMRIFCVFEQRSARESVIFLWVALSVECGLYTLTHTQLAVSSNTHMYRTACEICLTVWDSNVSKDPAWVYSLITQKFLFFTNPDMHVEIGMAKFCTQVHTSGLQWKCCGDAETPAGGKLNQPFIS